MTAAIYARYSTEAQRETSIEDQTRLARNRAAAEAWPVVAEYADNAISGSTPLAARPAAAAMLAAAMNGRFTALILEGLDRLSRDMVEQETIVRRLEHRGIRIIGLSDGYDSTSASGARKLHRGMRGLINEIYIDDLRAKVHRGLSGQVLRGFSAGGLPYGYRSVEVEGGRRLEVLPDLAAVVLRIYEQFAAGTSARKIAAELNAQRAPAPRGGTWALSAIHGHAQYNTGILRNAIYIGQYTWNKSQWVKDPDTGVRKRIERPESEWQRLDLPDLRIVPDDLWTAAQARLRGPNARGKGRPARSPWSGLLRCGHCGGPLIVADARAYGCGRHKDRGAAVCPGLRVLRKIIEPRLLEITREHLLSDESIAQLRAEIARLAHEHAGSAGNRTATAKRRLSELDREISRLIDAISAAPWSEAILARLKTAETERAQLLAEISTNHEPPTAEIVPRLIETYRAKLGCLPEALAQDADQGRAALRDLVGEITVIEEENELWAEMPAYGGGLLLNVVAGDRYNIKKRRHRLA